MLNKIIKLFSKKEVEPVDFEPLWKNFQEENFDSVIASAEKYISSKSDVTAKEALKLLGLSYFRKNSPEKALPYFQNAVKYTPEANDWFNIVTSATLSKKIQIGEDALDQAIKLQSESGHTQEPSIPYMKLYYACALRDIAEFDLALEQIEELRPIYEQLKITDTTFLHIRGMPFLSHTVETVCDIFKGLGGKFDSQKWFEQFSQKLDEDGQAYLAEVSANFTANK